MVITFPKQSEAMVTLFHGEGNFPLLFWYALTTPLELQEISVNLLSIVFYSVKRNIKVFGDGNIAIVRYYAHTL